MRRRDTGFTLMELLSCLVIVGVLGAYAVPLHRDALLRARRSDARDALLAIHALQERHYFAHGRYASGLAELGDAPRLRRSAHGFYLLDLQIIDDGQGFVANAHAATDGPQARDASCQSLTLDDAGRRGASGARCWN